MPLLDLFFSMFVIFIAVMWIWLVISIFIDIFRSDDLSGWGKAGWVVLIIIVPLIGVLIYLIARGDSMTKRRIQEAQAQQAATAEYIRTVAGSEGGSTADEIGKLAALRDSGVLTDEEYQQQKAKLLA